MDVNLEGYEQLETVKEYSYDLKLQKPEKSIFDLLSTYLKTAFVLDIGIGAGRTTKYLLPVVKKYIGIDYSGQMVEYCKKTYNASHASYFQADAREMKLLESNSFDFVLFSFNGIDCVDFEDRKIILNEIKRLGKSGSYFCFSAHNTRNLDKLYSFQFPKNPFNYWREYQRFTKIRSFNGEKSAHQEKETFVLRDGAENFGTDVLYIKPELQLKQLVDFGFKEIKLFEIKKGKEISPSALPNITDPWIYYLCKI